MIQKFQSVSSAPLSVHAALGGAGGVAGEGEGAARGGGGGFGGGGEGEGAGVGPPRFSEKRFYPQPANATLRDGDGTEVDAGQQGVGRDSSAHGEHDVEGDGNEEQDGRQRDAGLGKGEGGEGCGVVESQSPSAPLLDFTQLLQVRGRVKLSMKKS